MLILRSQQFSRKPDPIGPPQALDVKMKPYLGAYFLMDLAQNYPEVIKEADVVASRHCLLPLLPLHVQFLDKQLEFSLNKDQLLLGSQPPATSSSS